VHSSEAIERIEYEVLAKVGEPLTEVQRLLVESAWNGTEYKEVAEKSGIFESKLKYQAFKLWPFLSNIYGIDQKLSKNNLRKILQEYWKIYQLVRNENAEKSYLQTLPQVTLYGTIPDTKNFVGRRDEQRKLRDLILGNRCVVVTGLRGIGKTALVAQQVRQLIGNATQTIIWELMSSAPPLESFLERLLVFLGHQPNSLAATIDQKMDFLVEILKTESCVIVMDRVDNIFETDNIERAKYLKFCQRLIERLPKGCIVLTSRESIAELRQLETSGYCCYSWKLESLSSEDTNLFFHQHNLSGESGWETLAKSCNYNPLALTQMAFRVQEYTFGNVAAYLELHQSASSEVLVEIIRDLIMGNQLIDQHKQVLILMSKNFQKYNLESMPLKEVLELLHSNKLRDFEIMAALDTLKSFSLVQVISEQNQSYVTMSAAISKYILLALEVTV
jgi:ABC-type transport system involved in cytochrome c biogenesis ATPase subunit